MADTIQETIYIVGHNESGNSYTSVNPVDVVSIGLFNWYGARALNIAREIVNKNPEGSKIALQGASSSLYNQITSGNNNVWNGYVPGQHSGDISALKAFLGLDASRQVQDNQAKTDAGGYLSQAKSRGVTSASAQIYFADLYNQSPKQAGNIVNAVKSAGLILTLENLHNYAMKNTIMNKYKTRRNWTYEQLLNWSGEENITPPVNPPNSNGGNGTAGNIPPELSNVKDYILLFNNDTAVRYSDDNPQGDVYIKYTSNIFIKGGKTYG